MQTREEVSPDWVQIGETYRTKPVSNPAIAKDHGISETAVRKAAKQHKWVKASKKLTPCEPICEPKPKRLRTTIETATTALASASVADLTARGRNIILTMMQELEFLNRHADGLSELVEEHFNGEKDDRIRHRLQKALDHETRTKSSTQLASALQKLRGGPTTSAVGGRTDMPFKRANFPTLTQLGHLSHLPFLTYLNE